MDGQNKHEIPMNRMLDDDPTMQNITASSLREPGGSYTNPFTNSENQTTGQNANREPFASTNSFPIHNREPGCFQSCWYDRTGVERCLLVIFFLCIFIALVFFIALSTRHSSSGIMNKDIKGRPVPFHICATLDCVKTAGEIIDSMDQNVSPCDNFYQFACGGWHKKNPMPQKKENWDRFSDALEEVSYEIKELLEQKPGKNESRSIRNLRKGYNACVNLTSWDKAGVDPLLKIYDDYGGFPMINPHWDYKKFDLFKTIAEVRRLYDEQYLVGVYVIPDMKNSSRYSIYLDEGYLPGDRDLLASDDPTERKQQIHRMKSVATALYEKSLAAEIDASHFPHNHFHQPDRNFRQYDARTSPLAHNQSEIHKVNNNTEKHELVTNLPNKAAYKHDTGNIRHTTSNAKTKRSIGSKHKKKTLAPKIELQEMEQQFSIINDAWELWYFYVKLAKFMDETPDFRDDEKTYNPMKVSELKKFNHRLNIDWLGFLRNVFADTDVEVDENTRVIVAQPEYFHKLSKFLLATHPRALANALLYQLTLTLGTEIRAPKRYLSTEEKMMGIIGRLESREWLDCAQKMNNLMGLAMGKLFMNDKKKEIAKRASHMEGMFHDLRQTLTSTLKNETWLDKKTKTEAIKKSQHIHPVIGIPVKQQNETYIEGVYSNLTELNETDHFGNIKKLLHFVSTQSLQKVNKVPSKDKMLSSPVAVNSYYSSQRNNLQFPIGMMRTPFFRVNATPAIQFGSTGTIVSHEIFHGFDVRGRKWDSEGTLRPWWSENSFMNYLKRAKCFEHEYAKLPVSANVYDEKGHKVKVNSVRCMAENIADAQGLMLAWNAYKNKNSSDIRLVGLQRLNPDQLFYLSYAQIWCSNYSPEGLLRSLHFDKHAPSPYRVNGAIRNHAPFQKVFSCSKKSKMVDAKKCKIW